MPRINRNVLYIAIALLLGVLASFMAIHYINGQVAARTHAPVQEKMSAVVVPTHALQAGDTLTANDVASRDVPAEFVPADVLTPDNYGSYLGQVLRVPLAQGAPIPTTALEQIADHFSAIIKPDDVAYTIQVDETNSISGLIVPGDHIDILLLMSKNSKDTIRPLLSELAPLDAQRLSLAKKIGQLRVMLRSPENQNNLNLNLLSEADLLGLGRRGHGQGIQFIIGGGQ
jgi:pilus assembly protein CpaB